MSNVKVTTGTSTDNVTSPTCKCCDGRGFQQLWSGEKIICRACNGSGSWTPNQFIPIPTIPTTWPWWEHQPTYPEPFWYTRVYC